MVPLGRVLVSLLPGPSLAIFHMIDAGVGVQRRDSHLGEVEVIGAVVVAFLRLRVGPDDTVLAAGSLSQIVIQLRIPVADHGHVTHGPQDVETIHVDGRNGFFGGIHRVSCVVGRPQESLLFGRYRE